MTYSDSVSSGAILTVSANTTAQIWDQRVEQSQPERTDATINHAAATHGTAWLRRLRMTAPEDLAQSGKSGATLAGHADAVNHIASVQTGNARHMLTDTTVGLSRKDGTPLKKPKTPRVGQPRRVQSRRHWLVTCSKNKTARLWTRDQTAAGVSAGHSDAVIGAIFARNRGELVTSSKAETCALKDDQELDLVLNAHAEPIDRIVFAGTMGRSWPVRRIEPSCLADRRIPLVADLDAPFTAAASTKERWSVVTRSAASTFSCSSSRTSERSVSRTTITYACNDEKNGQAQVRSGGAFEDPHAQGAGYLAQRRPE